MAFMQPDDGDQSKSTPLQEILKSVIDDIARIERETGEDMSGSIRLAESQMGQAQHGDNQQHEQENDRKMHEIRQVAYEADQMVQTLKSQGVNMPDINISSLVSSNMSPAEAKAQVEAAKAEIDKKVAEKTQQDLSSIIEMLLSAQEAIEAAHKAPELLMGAHNHAHGHGPAGPAMGGQFGGFAGLMGLNDNKQQNGPGNQQGQDNMLGFSRQDKDSMRDALTQATAVLGGMGNPAFAAIAMSATAAGRALLNSNVLHAGEASATQAPQHGVQVAVVAPARGGAEARI